MKDTIKQSIIRLIEEKGEASKTQICDHIRELHGSTGDCVARRMRELVSAGILIKEQKEYADKTYFAYKVAPLAKSEIPTYPIPGFENTLKELDRLTIQPTKELKLNI